ncbi:hypothetical protein O6H91_15G076800 [Diphasiastrum complanatum]|uniref:Uncharacterized protein n=1 Tax=Diphasiastrum complanatum TaxID=34168 RepID=A0ACC2BJV6_DIPCM|nr:hypothetical protein O6H91_15G076800 [Diphasiastrum complanatum]
MGKVVGFEHDEEVTSPFSRAVAYANSLKRHRTEEDPAAFPSKRLHKGISAGANLTVDRFLYYEKGRWVEFPPNLAHGFSANLKAGKTAVELLVKSCVYLINFVQMVLVNSRSGYGRSIAWVDKQGKRYASSCPFEGPFLGLVLNRQNNNAVGAVKSLVAESRVKEDMQAKSSERMFFSEIRSEQEPQTLVEHDTEPESSCTGENDVECRLTKETEMHGYLGSTHSCSEAASGIWLELGSKVLCENEADGFAAVSHKIHRINKDYVPYQALKAKFLSGIAVPATKLTVQAVYRTVESGRGAEFRRQAFEMQKRITRSARGNANVRYVWFGSSKTVLQNILLHGFGQPTLMKRSSPGGVGVHFSGDDYPSLRYGGSKCKAECSLFYCLHFS